MTIQEKVSSKLSVTLINQFRKNCLIKKVCPLLFRFMECADKITSAKQNLNSKQLSHGIFNNEKFIRKGTSFSCLCYVLFFCNFPFHLCFCLWENEKVERLMRTAVKDNCTKISVENNLSVSSSNTTFAFQ